MQAAFAAAAQRRQFPMVRSNVAQLQRMSMVQGGAMSIQPMVVQNRVALVLDAESCLDRLYGGYFPGRYCISGSPGAQDSITEPDYAMNNNFWNIDLSLQIGVVVVNGGTCIAS